MHPCRNKIKAPFIIMSAISFGTHHMSIGQFMTRHSTYFSITMRTHLLPTNPVIFYI